MKFYVYIADAKLDRMLAELSSEDRQRLARELELDQGLLDLPEIRRGEADETRFARAAAVERHLEQLGLIGPLDAERPFIAERGLVRWGRFRRVRGGELVQHETESPVSFGFATDQRELIMAGSASRLLAQPPAAKVDEAAQAASARMEWYALAQRSADLDDVDQRCLAQAFEEALPPTAASDPRDWPLELRTLATLAAPTGAFAVSEGSLAGLTALPWMDQLATLRRDFRALPQGNLEFLARHLGTFVGGCVDATALRFEPVPRVLVASPLYVAMTL